MHRTVREQAGAAREVYDELLHSPDTLKGYLSAWIAAYRQILTQFTKGWNEGLAGLADGGSDGGGGRGNGAGGSSSDGGGGSRRD